MFTDFGRSRPSPLSKIVWGPCGNFSSKNMPSEGDPPLAVIHPKLDQKPATCFNLAKSLRKYCPCSTALPLSHRCPTGETSWNRPWPNKAGASLLPEDTTSWVTHVVRRAPSVGKRRTERFFDGENPCITSMAKTTLALSHSQATCWILG